MPQPIAARTTRKHTAATIMPATLPPTTTSVSAVIYARSRSSKVNHTNVNDEWTALDTPAEPQPIAAA